MAASPSANINNDPVDPLRVDMRAIGSDNLPHHYYNHDVDWSGDPYPGARPAWQNQFFSLGQGCMRLASHLDLYRLATIALCNVTRHDDEKWIRQYFHRTDRPSQTDALKSFLTELRTRVTDSRSAVVVIYGESVPSEWGHANMAPPLPLESRHPWLNPRPIARGQLTIVGFIVVQLHTSLNALGEAMHGSEMPPVDAIEITSSTPDRTLNAARRRRWRARVADTFIEAISAGPRSWYHTHSRIEMLYVHPAYYTHHYENQLISWAVSRFGASTLLTVATNFTKRFFWEAGFTELAQVCKEGTQLEAGNFEKTNFEADLMMYRESEGTPRMGSEATVVVEPTPEPAPEKAGRKHQEDGEDQPEQRGSGGAEVPSIDPGKRRGRGRPKSVKNEPKTSAETETPPPKTGDTTLDDRPEPGAAQAAGRGNRRRRRGRMLGSKNKPKPKKLAQPEASPRAAGGATTEDLASPPPRAKRRRTV